VSLTTRVLIVRGAGFAVGLAIAGSASPLAAALLAVVAPVGTIFVNLIRMTAMPLVASILVASVGSIGESRALGRTGGRALAIVFVLLTVAAVASAAIAHAASAAGQRSKRLRTTDPRARGATAVKRSGNHGEARKARSVAASASSATAPHIHIIVSNVRLNPGLTFWSRPPCETSPGTANVGSAPGGYSSSKSR